MATVTGSVTERTGRSGTVALILGALFVVSTVFTYVLSVEVLYDGVFGDYNVPNWVRALGSAGLPLGFFGMPFAFAAAWGGPGRGRAWVGLGLLVAGLAAFVTLLFWMG